MDTPSPRSVRAALAGAAAIGAWLLAVTLLEWILGAIGALAQSLSSSSGLFDLGYPPSYWGYGVLETIRLAVPFALGFFVAWRFVVPFTPGLGLLPIVRRSVLATAVAAATYLVAKVVVDMVVALSMTGPMFGNSFPDLGYAGPGIPGLLVQALLGSIGTFLSLLPLGILVGLLLQRWVDSEPLDRRGDV